MLACVPFAAAMAAAAAAAPADPLADSLQSVAFLNGGQVRATDTYARLTQCNGFTECYTTWECGSVRDYLFDTTAGRQSPRVPPVGMRSALLL